LQHRRWKRELAELKRRQKVEEQDRERVRLILEEMLCDARPMADDIINITDDDTD